MPLYLSRFSRAVLRASRLFKHDLIEHQPAGHLSRAAVSSPCLNRRGPQPDCRRHPLLPPRKIDADHEEPKAE